MVQQNYGFIDLTDDDEVQGLRVGNTFALEPVPAAIPISDYVQNNLQKVLLLLFFFLLICFIFLKAMYEEKKYHCKIDKNFIKVTSRLEGVI